MSGQLTSKLEALPAELGMSILRHIPDIRTLHSLVQASPIFHSLYLADRERVFTEATINELYSKNLDILGATRAVIQVVLEPAYHELLDLHNPKRRDDLQQGIEALYAQNENLKGHLVLSIDRCKTLLMIRAMVKWEIVEEGHWPFGYHQKDAIVHPDKVLDRDSFFWSWCLGFHVVAPGDDHNKQRFWIRRQAVKYGHEKQRLLLFGSLEEWEAFRREKWNEEILRRCRYHY